MTFVVANARINPNGSFSSTHVNIDRMIILEGNQALLQQGREFLLIEFEDAAADVIPRLPISPVQ